LALSPRNAAAAIKKRTGNVISYQSIDRERKRRAGSKSSGAGTTGKETPVKERISMPSVELPQRAGRSYKEMLKTVEARSKRMQCLVQPSVYGKVEAKAKQQGISVNEFVHSLLEAATE
jgi:hypothetical protein